MTEPTNPRLYRYPLEALTDAMGLSFNQGCRALGISGSTQQEYRDRGITERVADRLAVKVGLHPYEVWPEMADHQLEAQMVECVEPACDERFLPGNGRRYCSDRCRGRAAMRRHREDPEVRARQAEENARYRAESRPALRAYSRRYYQQNREQILADQRRRDHARRSPNANRTEAA